MYTIVIQTTGHSSTRTECCVSRDRKALVEMLFILEDSSRVKAYKVIDSDDGPIKDIYAGVGLGQMSKFTSDNFVWD